MADNMGILGALSGNNQMMQPEQIAMLEEYAQALLGAEGNKNRILQPVGPRDYQATHWSQGVADLINTLNAQVARQQAITGRERARTAASNMTPPNVAPATLEPEGLASPSPNLAPERGALQIAPEETETENSQFGEVQPDIESSRMGLGREVDDSPLPNANVPNQRGPVAPIITNQPDKMQNRLAQTGQTLVQSDRSTPHILPTESAPSAPSTNRPTIGGHPVYRREDFNAIATFPRPAPFRFGLNAQDETALRNLRTEDRKHHEDALTYQWTPQYQDVPGGRRWILPATGETGYIPVPVDKEVRTSDGTTITTRTIFDQDGRRHTYALEPGTPVPNVEPLPGAAQPQTTGPQTTGPQTTGPQTTGPQTTGPQSQHFLDRPFFSRPRDITTEQQSRAAVAGQLAPIATEPVKEAVERGRIANQTLSVTNMLESLLSQPNAEQIITGRAAAPLLEFARTVNGMFRGAGGWTPFNEDRLSMMEVFTKLNAYLASAASRELTNRPTQFDFRTFMDANPGLSNTITGNRILVQILKSWAMRDREIGQLAGNFAENRGATGRPSGFTNEMIQLYDRHMSSFGEMLLTTPGINIPIGFIYNNRRYIGGPPIGQNSRNSWEPINRPQQ